MTTRADGTPSRYLCALVLAIVAASLLPVSAAVASPSEPTVVSEVTIPFDAVAMEADDIAGRYYFADADEVIEVDASGTVLRTFTGLDGATGVALAGDTLWVVESSARTFAAIDLTTGTVADRISVPTRIRVGVVPTDGALWFLSDGSGFNSRALWRVDLATRTAASRGGAFKESLIRVPGDDDTLVAWTTTGYRAVDLTTNPVSVGPAIPGGRPVLSPDGLRFVAGSGVERRLDTLEPTGVVHPVTADRWSPIGGGILTDGLTVVREGWATAAVELERSGPVGTTIPTPDGTDLLEFAVGNELVVRRIDLAPLGLLAAPTRFVAGAAGEVRVVGVGLGAFDSAVVGGVPTTVTSLDSRTALVDIPPTLPVGTHALELSNPFGSIGGEVSIVPFTAADIAGVVSTGTGPVEGVAITLSGGALTTPVVTTSGPGGAYGFAGLAYGTDYRLDVHDPHARLPDHWIRNVAVSQPEQTVVDIEASIPLATGADLARLPLPDGPVGELEVEPTTGNVFVAVADELVAVAPDGTLLGRVLGLDGADGVAHSGGHVLVNAVDGRRVVAIDAATFDVVASWSTGGAVLTSGDLAVVSGSVFVVRLESEFDTSGPLLRLDPSTGALTATGLHTASRLGTIDGDDGVLVAFHQSTGQVDLYDVDATSVTSAGSLPTETAPAREVIGSAAADRIWTGSGYEYVASTGTRTVTTYAGSTGAVAASDAHGGLLLVGARLFSVDDTSPSHALPDQPADRASGLDADGDTAYLASSGQLAVWSLAPTIDGLSVPTGGSTAPVIHGSGLGHTTEVLVDGVPTPFWVDDPSTLTLLTAPLPAGTHTLVAVTPRGPSAPTEVTVIDPLGPPTDPVAVQEDGRVRVSWGPPASDGGAPVTSYRVVSSTLSQRTCTTTTLTCTVSGLVDGTTYTFSVTATTAQGTSPAAVTGPLHYVVDLDVDSTLDTTDVDPGDGTCADAAGDCSLRAAVQESNALEGTQVVRLAADTTYPLTRVGNGEDGAQHGDLDITDGTRIEVSGGRATVSASGLGDRAFDVRAQGVAISDLTVTGGSHVSNGGAIDNRGGLTLARVELSGSAINGGGAVSNSGGTLDIADSAIVDSGAFGLGGGVLNAGQLTLTRTTVEDCIAGFGGGLFNWFGSTTVDDSDIVDNTAVHLGGGLASVADLEVRDSRLRRNDSARGGGAATIAGDVTVSWTTISSNTATVAGGGVLAAAPSAALTGVTLLANSAPSGASVHTELAGSVAPAFAGLPPPEVRLGSSVLSAAAGGGSHCALLDPLTVRSDGGNVADDPSCGLTRPDDVEIP